MRTVEVTSQPNQQPPFPPGTAAEIRQQLTAIGARCLSRDQIAKSLLTPEHRARWQLSAISVNGFIVRMIEAGLVQPVKIDFPSRTTHRYVWDNPSPYEVVQTLSTTGYFSHFTAIHLHGLTEQLPKAIYLNVEQNLAPGGGELDQQAIDRTFQRACRISHNTATFADYKVTLLNGGNTGRLGVTELRLSRDTPLQVTAIERTLIDATVRPVYSGGVFQVSEAYKQAKGRVSVPVLVGMLDKLNYTYPYHQAIGYYLERAKYDAADIELLRRIPIEYDFYLDYALRQKEYKSRWRLFVPKGF